MALSHQTAVKWKKIIANKFHVYKYEYEYFIYKKI